MKLLEPPPVANALDDLLYWTEDRTRRRARIGRWTVAPIEARPLATSDRDGLRPTLLSVTSPTDAFADTVLYGPGDFEDRTNPRSLCRVRAADLPSRAGATTLDANEGDRYDRPRWPAPRLVVTPPEPSRRDRQSFRGWSVVPHAFRGSSVPPCADPSRVRPVVVIAREGKRPLHARRSAAALAVAYVSIGVFTAVVALLATVHVTVLDSPTAATAGPKNTNVQREARGAAAGAPRFDPNINHSAAPKRPPTTGERQRSNPL